MKNLFLLALAAWPWTLLAQTAKSNINDNLLINDSGYFEKPGVNVLVFSNKEDWPFFWGENEVTVGICANYILLSAAVNALQ